MSRTITLERNDVLQKVEYFDGKGDVNAFIVKVELYNKLKKYKGEDAAASLASRLQEPGGP